MRIGGGEKATVVTAVVATVVSALVVVGMLLGLPESLVG